MLHAREVEHDTGLIADHFAVVPGRDRDHVASAELELCAIVHDHLLAPGEDVSQVRHLAAVGAGQRLDVLGPAPSGLKRGFANRAVPIFRISTCPLPLMGRTSSGEAKLFFSSRTVVLLSSLDGCGDAPFGRARS